MTKWEKANATGIVGLLGSALTGLLDDHAFHLVFGIGFFAMFLFGGTYTAIHPEERS